MSLLKWALIFSCFVGGRAFRLYRHIGCDRIFLVIFVVLLVPGLVALRGA